MSHLTQTGLARGIIALSATLTAWGGIILIDGIDPVTLRTHGMVDWIGHLLTALIIAMGLWALRLPIPIWSVLVGGVVLDLGHLLTFSGLAEPIAGSSRNGSHSLIVVVGIALIGFIDRKHANIWLGVAIGALTHLLRDMGTGTVPLLWPMLDAVWGVSFRRHLFLILGVGIAMIGSGMLLDVYARATRPD